MWLRFMFLLTTRLAAWLRLARREEAWKTAEILILRHQLAVLQRQQPRRPTLNWADRALLATLLSVIPKARRHGLGLLVTPDTILPNVETYLLADPLQRSYVLEHLDELVVKAVGESGGYGMLIGPHSTAEQQEEFRQLILAEPRNYIAQPTLSLSRAPCFLEGEAQ